MQQIKNTNMKTTTNDLRHTILCNDVEGNNMTIKIRLNDECKNGHQDFSITADIYKKGKIKSNASWLMGGCLHEEILKVMPELKIFVNLHLCDYKGIPMHPIANGFYFLRNGFNNTKIESPLFKGEYCEYYRINEKQFNLLNTSQNQIQFTLNLQSLGILNQWEQEANEAIKILEKMTDNTFIVDSKKTQLILPTNEELKEEEERQTNGYYTESAELEREKERYNIELQKLINDRDKEILKANIEFEVKKQVLQIGGKKALDNCIFYNHTKQLSFNWRSYDNISTDLINKVVLSIVLPDGVTIKNDITK